jgi:hypothetical protein
MSDTSSPIIVPAEPIAPKERKVIKRKPKVIVAEPEAEVVVAEVVIDEPTPEADATDESEPEVVAEAVKKPKAEKKPKEPKAEKEKRTRKPSPYNIMLGEFMKKISMEEAEKPKEDRIPGGDRMKMAQEMYREWKKTSVKA